MELFQKIIYLLSLFFPIMLFFALGLWIAWMLWFRNCRLFHLAVEQHHQLVDELNELYQRQYLLTEKWEIPTDQATPLHHAPPPITAPTEEVVDLDSNEDISQLRTKILTLKSRLEQSKTELSELNNLRDENQSLKELLEEIDLDADTDSFSEIGLVEAILNDFADEPVRRSAELGIVFEEKPDHADDLTKLDNLSQNDAIRLNNLGVYRYRQIELWSPKHFEHVCEKLEFNESIQYSAWQKQAAELHSVLT